jgi:hypothetical protein
MEPSKKDIKKAKDKILKKDLNVNDDELKALKKKLAKVAPRSERGVETMFRLLSKNQYTLNVMVDRKSNILISINAIIMSIVIGTVLNQLDTDPHLIFPAVIMMSTNLISIAFAVFATRPDRKHGDRKTNNLMFHGNFNDMKESEYIESIKVLMYNGDELYETIAKDTYYLGKSVNRKFKLLRKSFNAFLIGIILSVFSFTGCHVYFGDTFNNFF